MAGLGTNFAHSAGSDVMKVGLIGSGGMGEVYKARDTHLDRFVAIKVLPPEKVADPGRKLRFVQEAKAASALNHANIIHIYDVAADAGVTKTDLEVWTRHLAGEDAATRAGRLRVRQGFPE